MTDRSKCEIPVIPLAEWVENAGPDQCPPCVITPLASHYVGALEEAGEVDLAENLKKVYESGDVLTIAKELDSIKANVGESLKDVLMDFDCMGESWKDTDD